MKAEQFKRVLWRCRTRYPGETVIPYRDLERAVFLEIGCDKRTLKRAIYCLRRINWIQKWSKTKFRLTGKDEEE